MTTNIVATTLSYAGSPLASTADAEVIVREYRRAREYRSDLHDRRHEGWTVVSVLERPGRVPWTRWLGVFAALVPPTTEYLVTYRRRGAERVRPRPLSWLGDSHMPRRRARLHLTRLWWSLFTLALALLLTYGFFSLFAEPPF